MTGLAGYEQVPVARLSSGQKRRVGLARLWLPHAAPLWLLDEPMTALDVQMIARLNQRLADHAATAVGNLLGHRPQLEQSVFAEGLRPDSVQALDIMGEVEGRVCVLVDDMVDSRWTLTVSAWLLRTSGSTAVWPMALSQAGHD